MNGTSLQGRVALVTGGSKGIGKAICLRLADAGATVIVTARDEMDVHVVQTAIAAAGGDAMALTIDVTDVGSVGRGIQAVHERFGRLDILVNNAGGAIVYGAFSEIDDEDWRAAFDLNVLGCVHMVRAALPLLKETPCARIITISSISGIQPGLFNPHYSAMKAATINLSKSLAKAYAADGIRANVVCPGPVHSDAWDRNVEHMASTRGVSIEDARKSLEISESKKIPLGRIGEGRDIAGLVAFLASDEGEWITGSCFHINGGKLETIS